MALHNRDASSTGSVLFHGIAAVAGLYGVTPSFLRSLLTRALVTVLTAARRLFAVVYAFFERLLPKIRRVLLTWA